ncbi:guanylate kinase [Sulfuricella sp.]|uniref:guanylate kinase n=1 Tax=Sulfuricella sp. TaxID=2099377 RepID=UPI002C9413F3|nr:guanylate kinase [Sulfuricella sp.]HUX62352.1 guanylate kinase [Sulfuricella sp.]
MASGNLFIVTAPSGAGKTSLVRALLQNDSQVKLSVSYTTRPARPGEVDGKDYHFVTEQKFLEMLERGDFLESAQVYGNRYGTSQPWIESAMNSGTDILLEIDWQGAAQVRKIFPRATGIFILPPSLEALLARLTGRGQDSEEIIARRLAAAREDIGHVEEFDYVIINDIFETALQDLISVIRAQRLTASRQLSVHADMIGKMK